MKFLCDVHIPYKLMSFFRSNDIEAVHVNSLVNGSYSKDSEIADFADENELILISKDADFKLSYLLSKKRKKVVKINLGNVSNMELISLMDKNLDLIRILNQKPNFLIELGKESSIYI